MDRMNPRVPTLSAFNPYPFGHSIESLPIAEIAFGPAAPEQATVPDLQAAPCVDTSPFKPPAALSDQSDPGDPSEPPVPDAFASTRTPPRARPASKPAGISYKFQRLREQLREAIERGEFNGKLPGERSLAKRFHVNAKTLSKALTDLAAEGLLDRSIGRGTFVKGTAPAPQSVGRWLVLCDPEDASGGLVAHLRQANPQVEVSTDVRRMRPSYINQFTGVIDAAAATPEAFLRDLVVRNLPVVAVGREPRTYSVHTVLADVALGASQLARDLLLAGHRRLAAVEAPGSARLTHALRQAAARQAADATVDACSPEDASAIVSGETGATALVCDSPASAEQVRAALERRGIRVPADVSVAAVGCLDGEPPCSGYYVNWRQVAATIVRLLEESPARPATLWLAGEMADRGTLSHACPVLPGSGENQRRSLTMEFTSTRA